MSLPPLLDAWATDLLGAAVPEETQATCHSCAMLPEPDAPAAASSAPVFYDPRIKCCTYTPNLYSFLVGRILRDDDPAMAHGQRAVAERVAAGVGVTPLGLVPSPQQQVLYQIGSKTGFGRTLAMRCPYYVEASGGCSIWRHRNAVCSTYFCKYDRGAVGHRFWTALTALLTIVSEELAIHCAVELGLGPDAIRRLAARLGPEPRRAAPDPRELDGQRAADHDAIWGAWRGREAAYYVECARVVDALSWAEALAIAGARARLHAAAVLDAHRALTSTELPAAVRAGTVTIRPGRPGQVILKGYSGGDELAAPAAVLDLLPYFDGRPLPDTLADLADATGITVEPAFLRKLLDFEILVAAAE